MSSNVAQCVALTYLSSWDTFTLSFFFFFLLLRTELATFVLLKLPTLPQEITLISR